MASDPERLATQLERLIVERIECAAPTPDAWEYEAVETMQAAATALRQPPVLSVEGLRQQIEKLRDDKQTWTGPYYAGFRVGCSQVLEILAAPVEARAPQETPAEDQGETLIDLAKRLAEDIDFAVDVTEPRDVRLARFRTLIEAVIGGWEADEQSEDTVIVNAVTAAVREADQAFQTTGGSSKHWVRDCFLPTLNSAGLFVAQRVPQPAEPTRETDIGPQGRWICRTCGFQLTKAWLRACDGAVGVDVRPVTDICTNDGSSLQPITWKEDAEDANRVGLEQMKRADAAEAQIATLRQELAAALKLADSNLHPGRYPDPAFTIEGGDAGSSHMHALVTALSELLKTHQTTCICAIHEAARAALAASEPAAQPEKE